MTGDGESRPALVLVGGFLGAGKTTLILAAAKLLEDRGLRAAAILNDQGDDLVDTHLARENGLAADQVAGGCFCCRFSDLVEAAERLRAYAPDVIFAEAVGSCTDIVATTLRPLLRDYGDRFRVAPFTVLVDPQRERELLSARADPDLAYLFRNQRAEADIICYTKQDAVEQPPEVPRSISARTGLGVAEWLDEVLSGGLAGGNILDIDYARYARAEAALAWLNCRVAARCAPPLSPAMLAGPLLDRLDASFAAASIRIVHLKLMDECPTGYIKAALCETGGYPQVEGVLDASPAERHELLLNLRAVAEPERLREIVERELSALPAQVEWPTMQCFRSSPPSPATL